jgi:hypothetical protein
VPEEVQDPLVDQVLGQIVVIGAWIRDEIDVLAQRPQSPGELDGIGVPDLAPMLQQARHP